MPPSSSRSRPSAFDRFTDASASAISSGYSAVMALGPQPKGPNAASYPTQFQDGSDWLKSLKQFSGMYDGSPGSGLFIGEPGEARDHSDEDEDLDSDAEGSSRPKKKSKGNMKGKRNSKGSAGVETGKEKDSASRKAQNRLAQREFRQRKQQYIRALETRVELMSSDHDTQVDRLRFALRGLLAENNQLRQIVAGFASFVGLQGIGGPLQQAGVTREELEYLITNSAEKVMTEVWQHWPGAKECETLRQLRLESNLPPEGLPESNRLPDHGVAKTAQSSTIRAATAAAAAANGANGSPPSSSKTTSPSSTAPNGKAKNGKAKNDSTTKAIRKRKGSIEKEKDEALDGIENPQSGPGSDPPSSVGLSMPSDNAQVLASFFGNGNNLLQSPIATPSAFTFTPSFTGLATPSIGVQPQQQQQQESNALLASLFGASGMSGFVVPGQDGNNGMMNSFGNQQMATGQINPGQFGQAPNRQKTTVPNAEEPEEIQRIDRMTNQLKKEYDRYGSGKEPNELEKIGESLHELIRHMANFRRQPSYHLPLVLQPCEIQQTRPHDPLIDALPFPGIRQNIIAQQENLNIEDVILSILQYCKIHSPNTTPASKTSSQQQTTSEEDLNDEQNWELLYGFLIAYPQLVDQHTLDISNRWRASRKESILSFDDLTLRQI